MAFVFGIRSESSSPNIQNEKEDKEVTSLFALFRILPLYFSILRVYGLCTIGWLFISSVRLLYAMNNQPVLYCRSH